MFLELQKYQVRFRNVAEHHRTSTNARFFNDTTLRNLAHALRVPTGQANQNSQSDFFPLISLTGKHRIFPSLVGTLPTQVGHALRILTLVPA